MFRAHKCYSTVIYARVLIFINLSSLVVILVFNLAHQYMAFQCLFLFFPVLLIAVLGATVLTNSKSAVTLRLLFTNIIIRKSYFSC